MAGVETETLPTVSDEIVDSCGCESCPEGIELAGIDPVGARTQCGEFLDDVHVGFLSVEGEYGLDDLTCRHGGEGVVEFVERKCAGDLLHGESAVAPECGEFGEEDVRVASPSMTPVRVRPLNRCV